MSRKVLGLDIRYSGVSAVLVKSGINGNWIEAYEYVAIPDKKSGEKPGEKEDTGIDRALVTIAEKIDITGCVCIAAVPAGEVFFRNMKVPFNDRKKIRQILPFELESVMPFSVENLVIDFQTLNLPGQTDQTDIIAACIEKVRLQSYLDKLASIKIEPETVTVGGYASAVFLSGSGKVSENFIYVDMDRAKSALYIISSGGICLIRPFTAVSNAQYKTSLCTGIQRTLFAFDEIVYDDFKPDLLLIGGYDLDDNSMAQDIEQQLGVPVKQADLVRDDVTIIKNHPASSWKPGLMDNALALAMVEIERKSCLNFHKTSFAAKKYWEKHKKSIVKSTVLLGLVLVSAVVSFMIDSYSTGKRIDSLDAGIIDVFKTTFPDVKRIVDPVQQMRVKIEEKRKTSLFSGKTENNILKIDILSEISKSIPKDIDVAFTRLVISRENIQITGGTDTFNAVDDIKSRLEKEDIFKKVTISSANIEKSGNRVNFKLKIQL